MTLTMLTMLMIFTVVVVVVMVITVGMLRESTLAQQQEAAHREKQNDRSETNLAS